MSRKVYLVKEEDLLRLLAKELELDQLEASGVDNWGWYGEGREQFLLDAIEGRVSKEEIPDEIDFEYVARLDLKNFKLCDNEIYEDDLK